jgi:cell division protein ZipA
MDLLRWILLGIGIVILAAVYLAGRRGQRADDHGPVADDHDDGVRDDTPPMPPVAARTTARPVKPAEHPPENLDDELSRLSDLIAEQRVPDKAIKADVAAKPAARPPVTSDKPTGTPRAPAAAGEEKFIILHITARPDLHFAGPDLLRSLETAGMVYGDMHIFHRPAGPATQATVFSLVNMLEPGTFDPDNMDGFTTVGLSLFLRLPGPLDGIAAFEAMLSAARQLADDLGGDLRDASRSILTRQTIEHMREDILEYQRRLRVAHASP